MTDIQRLKALAEAATKCMGPMRVEADYNGVHQVIGDGGWKILNTWHTPDGKGKENAEFFAAASPAAVLELIAEIETLRWKLDEESDRVKIASDLQKKAINGRDQLKTENTDLHATLQAAKGEIERLKAESEALRQQADRYEWLRSRDSSDDPELSVIRWIRQSATSATGESPRLEELDSAIDAAMSKESSHG